MLDSMREIMQAAEEAKLPFWEVVLRADMEERQVTREASWDKMRLTWRAMLEADATYQAELRSVSGLVGGDGGRMREAAAAGVRMMAWDCVVTPETLTISRQVPVILS